MESSKVNYFFTNDGTTSVAFYGKDSKI